MGVLAMLELEGDTAALLEAGRRLEELLPDPPGVLVRIVAPTEDGIALFQLWESAEARATHADDPGHASALAESGMTDLVRGSRSRVFDDAELEVCRSSPS